MNERGGLRLLVALTILGAAGAFPSFAAAGGPGEPVVSPPAAATTPDPPGDTLDDEAGTPLVLPSADIVSSSVAPGPDGIELTARVKEPADPITDQNWTNEATFVSWELDTSGDQQPDFVVEYFVHANRLVGVVHRPSDAEDAPPLCNLAAAGFGREVGYTAVVEPTCIGSPTAIAYRVGFFYDTKAGDGPSTVGRDVSPDTGLTAPVSLPAPIAPAAPQATAPGPAPGPPPTGVPTPAGGALGSPRQAAAVPSPAPGAAATPTPSALARTGPSEPIRFQLALAGFLLMLAGLCFLSSVRSAACPTGPTRIP